MTVSSTNLDFPSDINQQSDHEESWAILCEDSSSQIDSRYYSSENLQLHLVYIHRVKDVSFIHSMQHLILESMLDYV
ncbi:hypothetical protein OIU79_028800 [Salix purpurea]|uniref:Uncharacterized protein n=1 Tax=Salix purpurea TaxID=77065 RepID=A0A9Q1A3D2_SALPP|nr:hypothetical protein OIU79_028800 [Salix purpurea]